MALERRPHVLVIGQGVSIDHDDRLRMQCDGLARAGVRVSVVCPRPKGTSARRRVDGIDVYSYRRPRRGGGFATAYTWLRITWLTMVVWRRQRVDVLQASGAPDVSWILGSLWHRRGVRFVFDQRELSPELYLARRGRPHSTIARARLGTLRWLERRTYASADQVIVPNDLWQEIAIRRGGCREADTTVMLTAPEPPREAGTEVLVDAPADLAGRRGHHLAYLATPDSMDGQAQLVVLMEELFFHRWRNDILLTVIGVEDDTDELREAFDAAGLGAQVTFVAPDKAAGHLSSVELGICPEPRTPLTDISARPEVLLYLAHGLPTVGYDLSEVGRLAGGSLVTAPSEDIKALADAVEAVIADPQRRFRMRLIAHERALAVADRQSHVAAYVMMMSRLAGISTDLSDVVARPAEADEGHRASA